MGMDHPPATATAPPRAVSFGEALAALAVARREEGERLQAVITQQVNRIAELADDMGDVFGRKQLQSGLLHAGKCLHFLRQEAGEKIPGRRRRHRRRPQRMVPAAGIAGDQTAMMQLRRNPGAMGVHAFAQAGEAGQETIIGNGGLPPGDGANRPGHAGHAANDQASAAGGLGLMIGDQLIPGAAVVFGKADTHRGDHDAVAQGQAADPARAGKMRVAGCHGCITG